MFDKLRQEYGCKETPNIKINLVDNDEIKYTIVLGEINKHSFYFGSEYKELEFSTPLMNPEDYSALVSKEYQKYIIETEQLWRNAKDGTDQWIELPAQVFHKMDCVRYETDYYNNKPAQWDFRFSEWKNSDD